VFGVSPAFVLSAYGHDFSLDNYCEALPRIRRLGFDAFQLEIYTAAAVPEWLRGGRRVQRIATDLGLNFDTGHAWACREMVPLLPFELAGRFFGTHLGDNRGTDNVKMPLGQGTIPWGPLLWNLRSADYQGSLDIEIGCPAGEVEQHYSQGLALLRSLITASKGDQG
jgi:hypothetical protein